MVKDSRRSSVSTPSGVSGPGLGAPVHGACAGAGRGRLETTADRRVHAVTRRGIEIVRYERAGKWFLEWPHGSMIPCQHVGVGDAARMAADHSDDIRFSTPGGKVFDAKVRRFLAEESA